MTNSSSSWTPAAALSELGLDPLPDLSFQIHVKLAYRRACKKWHPDHFVKAPAAEQQSAEERFKRSKQAYEYLEVLHQQGKWPHFSSDAPTPSSFVFSDFSEPTPAKHRTKQTSTRRPTQHDPSQARAVAARIFASWPMLMAEFIARGDGLEASNFRALARATLGRARIVATTHPEAFRHEFLSAFWSSPTPGLARAALAGCQALRDDGMAWAASICTPLALRHVFGTSVWSLFDAIAQRCASQPPSLSHQEALHELTRHGSPLADPSHAHLVDGTPLMARLLDQAPWAAEILAPRCSKDSMASSLWLDRAMASRADPRALTPWFESIPLVHILLKTQALSDSTRRHAWTDALAGRIYSESPQPEHPPHYASSRFTQSRTRLADIELALSDISPAADEAIAAYDPQGSISRKAFSCALSGDLDGMLAALAHGLAQGFDATSFMGMPIACALACKAANSPHRFDALTQCIHALPEYHLQTRDAFGLSAHQWLDARTAALTPMTSSPTSAASPRSA